MSLLLFFWLPCCYYVCVVTFLLDLTEKVNLNKYLVKSDVSLGCFLTCKVHVSFFFVQILSQRIWHSLYTVNIVYFILVVVKLLLMKGQYLAYHHHEHNPAGIYLLKVNNENTRANVLNLLSDVIHVALVLIVNLEQIFHIVLVFPMLNWNK